MLRRAVLAVLVVAFPLCDARTAAPVARLTGDQARSWRERNRWEKVIRARYEADDLDGAIEVAKKALALERAVWGEVRPGSLALLSFQALLQEEQGQFAGALKARREVHERRKQLHPPDDWRVTDARLDLEDARFLARADAKDRRRLRQADAWNGQVFALWRQGKSRQALPLAQKALAVRREILGEKHRNTAVSWFNVAAQQHALKHLREAERCYLKSLAIRKEAVGEFHPEVAQTMTTLGLLYKEMADFAPARPLLEQARDRLRAALGEGDPAYATAVNNLALLLQEQGDFTGARLAFEQACAIYKTTMGEDHPDYATALNNLASVYQSVGDFARARPLLERARDIRRAALGAKHPEYAGSLNNLANLYEEIGDDERALALHERARGIRKEALGEKHPAYAQSLSTLASFYQKRGEHERARSLYEQARDIREATLGKKHPDYALSLHFLARLLQRMEKYEQALPLFEQARDVRKAVYGEKHPEYAASLNNLAGLYQSMGDYEKAQKLFEQVRAFVEESLGKKHLYYAQNRSGFAGLLHARGAYGGARRMFGEALDAERLHLEATFSALSDRQRLDLLARSRGTLNACLSLPNGPAEEEFRRVLEWKAAVSARQEEDRFLRDHPRLAPLLARLRAARAGLAKLAAQHASVGRNDWLKQFREREEQKEKLEVLLAEASSDFRSLRRVDPKRLAGALPRGAALVDLFVYRHRRPDPDRKGHWLVHHRLSAFVLHRSGKVRRLNLGPMSRIEEAIRAWRKPLEASPSGAVDEKAGQALRRRLWLPLERVLGGAKTVLIAPDGLLCGLPFGGLPGSRAGAYLIEEFGVVQLASSRQVLDLRGAETPKAEGLLAVGGLDYGRGTTWDSLLGSSLETQRVARLYRERFPRSRPPLVLKGAKGGRTDLFEALSARPRWRYLHLATHGYFSPPEKSSPRKGASAVIDPREELAYRRNPLLLSGLVLSGANASSDGLLTAEEVCGLDLRGCELVALSACETGLGKVAGGEGVLGLQRAFHLAGARSVVASLWNVSDPATSVLMERFYSLLWGKKKVSKLEALRQAQLFVLRNPKAVRARAEELRKQAGALVALRGVGRKSVLLPEGGKGQGARSDPAWWAAFVLSGDWR